ncbi:MAG: hypothetical protein P8164_03890 [Gammaproteobacteria bacterium]
MARLDVYEHSPAGENNAGILDATVRNDAVSVAFTPRRRYPTPLVLHLALLGVDLKSRVTAGEPAGKHLSHDFVARDFQQDPRAQQHRQFRWALPGRLSRGEKDMAAIALWVTTADDPTALQAPRGG